MTDQDPTQPFEGPQPMVGLPASPAPDVAPPAAAPTWGQQVQPAQPPVAPPPVWAPPASGQFGAPVQPAAAIPPTGFDGPLVPLASRSRGGGPLRWVVALLVVALVVAGGLGATLLLTSGTSGTSAVLGYVPADTTTYAEVRLDLPGGQRAELAKTLSAFPGFADQASLDAKLGELYDRIVKAASNNKHDYQTEIAPWFTGQLAVAEGLAPAPSPAADPTASLPVCTGGDTATPAPSASDVLGAYPAATAGIRGMLLASISDSAKAAAWVGSVLSQANVKATDLTCDGVAVHVVQSSAASIGTITHAGWAILGDKVLVAGDLDSIRLAIATKGGGGLSATPNFGKAVAALKGDHVGFVYEDLRAGYLARLESLKAKDTDGTATAALNVLVTMLPEWLAGDVRAADGNFVLDSVSPALASSPTTNRTSDLAAVAPSTTVALLDLHDVGQTLGSIRTQAAAEPKLQPYVKQVDNVLGLVGGFDAAIGWIGDAGLAVTRDGATVSGGILIRPQDGAAARHLFTQIRSLADLAGATSGTSITDADYKGATLTTVDLSALAPLLKSVTGSSLGGMSIPSDLKLVYAVTDKVVILTLDTSFAKAVIDASQGGDSLAKDARFTALQNKVGAQTTGLMYLDVTATREIVEGLLPAASRAKYDSDVRAYLLPFDALISSGTYDNGLNRGTMILSVKH